MRSIRADARTSGVQQTLLAGAGVRPDTRVLAEAKPRFFILENVYALTFDNKASKPAFTRLLREIEAAGYKWRWKVLNAADHGVPQARPRLFVVGCRRATTCRSCQRLRTTGSGNGAGQARAGRSPMSPRGKR